MTATLASTGLLASWVADGKVARQLLEENPDVQLLIADTTSGSTPEIALRELRSHLAWSGLPVILIVDPTNACFMTLLETYGAADFICAPADSDLLTARIQAVLRR